MEPAKVRDAARLLVEARRTGNRVPGLPQGCRPGTAADANAIIDEVTRQMGEPIAGWASRARRRFGPPCLHRVSLPALRAFRFRSRPRC